MNMTRFEYRLLRFFNDACIPLFSFNINTRADQVWRTELPTYFALLDLIRQSVFAFACLNLWRFSDLKQILDQDNAATPLTDPPDGDFTHVFHNLAVLDSDENIFGKTAGYLTSTVEETEKHIADVRNHTRKASQDIMFFSSSLIFAFLGLHPHRIMQVVDFESDPPLDILSFSLSLFEVLDQPAENFGDCVLLIVKEFNSLKINYSKFASGIISELRSELNEYFFALATFYGINSTTSAENEVFSETLRIMEKCYGVTLAKGYPVPMFRVLFAIPTTFSELVRQKHPLALKILFVYCCFCVYLGFHLLEKSNIWQDYMDLYIAEFGPIGMLEQAVNEVVIEMKEVNYCQFTDSLREFDSAVMERFQQLSPRFDEILALEI